MASNVLLSPIQELAPGQVAAIRNQVIKAVTAKASKELSLPLNKLVVRDIRAYSDLAFGVHADYLNNPNPGTINVWPTFEFGGAYSTVTGAGAYLKTCSATDTTTMADQRYVAIYGVRDLRLCRTAAAAADKTMTLIKFDVGNADRAIWDASKCEAYTESIAGITSSAITIPPLASYQISVYPSIAAKEPDIQLMGVVVEPAGLLISPLTRTEETTEAIQTQLIPVMELAPGEIGHIRNSAKDTVLAMAMSELNLPREKLVIRDIRPYTDLGWCTNITSGVAAASQFTTANTHDSWCNASAIAVLQLDVTDAFADAATTYRDVVVAGSTQMADARFVGIYGVRDGKMGLATVPETGITLLKITSGGNDRVIWDLQNKDAYPNAQAAVCPSVVVLPQNTEFQFGFHNGWADDASGTGPNIALSLMGFVVEAVGKTLSP